MTKLVNKLVYDWVVFHKRLLAPENLLKFDELVALYEELDAHTSWEKTQQRIFWCPMSKKRQERTPCLLKK